MTVFSELLFLRGFVIFVYLGLLSVAAFMDWNTRTIKDRFPIGIVLLGFAALFLFPEHDAVDRLIGAAAAAGPMLILALALILSMLLGLDVLLRGLFRLLRLRLLWLYRLRLLRLFHF